VQSVPSSLDIVIPARNAFACLDLTLSSLLRQSVPQDQWNIVVVDDGSDDDVPDGIDQYRAALPLHVVRLAEREGRSAARNAGAACGNAPLILFLDADGMAGPTVVERHLALHRTRPETVLSGARYDIGLPAFASVLGGHEYGPPSPLEGDPREKHGLVGAGVDLDHSAAPWLGMSSCNLSLPRNVFEAVGGFDEAMVGWGLEDLELCYRVYRHYSRDPGHFAYEADAYTMHVPQLRDKPALHREADVNLEYVRMKHRHYEMELLQPHRWPQTRDAISFCRALVRDYVRRGLGAIPGWVSDAVPGDEDVIVLGRAAGLRERRSGRTVTLNYSEPESVANLHLLGVSLPFKNGEFDSLVNVDMWLRMPAQLLSSVIYEGLRVARSLVLVASAAAVASMALDGTVIFGRIHQMLRAEFAVTLETRLGERALRVVPRHEMITGGGAGPIALKACWQRLARRKSKLSRAEIIRCGTSCGRNSPS
jgi:glycosyltransferase involved in cell wall biosynthesis